MIKQSELEVMVCDLFVDAYRAGASGAEHNYGAARGSRAHLIAKIGEVYAELEYESYGREQKEVELLKATKENINLREQVRSLQETIRKLTDTDEEVPDHHDAFDAMFPGCTPDDLPFPDVVAGFTPATTEASADAEGEEVPING